MLCKPREQGCLNLRSGKPIRSRKMSGIASGLAILFLLSGCASGRYIEKPTSPPPQLGISSRDEAISVALTHVIIPNGPGAWVKDARWDEYVIKVQNLTGSPMTVERVRILDPRGVYIDSGVDPSQLEKVSETMARIYKDAGIQFAIGMAPAAVGGAALAAGSIGTAAGALALAPVAMIAAPIYFFGKQHADQKDKEAIEAGFHRRRLNNSTTLAGNATIIGSVFFPMVPNPRSLAVEYRMGNTLRTIELPTEEKLKGLHVAPPAPTTAGKKGEKKETGE